MQRYHAPMGSSPSLYEWKISQTIAQVGARKVADYVACG